MLDALYKKLRMDGSVVSQAVIIAYGVSENDLREVIGVDVVESESTDSWTTFLRGLVDRGLHGVKLVVSDAPRPKGSDRECPRGFVMAALQSAHHAQRTCSRFAQEQSGDRRRSLEHLRAANAYFSRQMYES